MNERLPSGLGKGPGARLWRDVVSKWDLRPDELRILEDACREAALINRLEKQVEKSDVMIPGSMGQLVVNPAIQEIRQHRNVLKQLLNSLKLPDEDDESSAGSKPAAGVSAQSDRGRAVALAGWRRA